MAGNLSPIVGMFGRTNDSHDDDRLTRDRFEAVSRASPVGIFHADLDGTVTYVNPRLQGIFGLDERELLGRHWLAFVHPADAGALLDGWRRANAERQAYEHEFRVLLPTGESRWVHGRSAVVCDADGRPIQTVGTVEDVTARRVAVERTRGLLAISGALATALGADDVARAVAEHVVPVVGATSSIVVLATDGPDGPALVRVGEGGLPAEARDDWMRLALDARLPLTDVVRTGEPVLLGSPADMAARYPGVAELWERIGARAACAFPLESVFEREGRRFGALGFRFPTPRTFREGELAFLRAIAQQCAVSLERGRLFDAARLAREEAAEASRAKSEFLARMSHELRTPLNAIAGHLQLIEMGLHGPVTAQQLDALQRVNRAQRHLLGLINDVLNLARLESGRVEFAIAPITVSDVLADVRPMIEPQLAAKGLAFSAHLPEDDGSPPLLVWADREKLLQVLLNLVSNAIKFTERGGAVTLTLAPDPTSAEHATISVRDTGVGIPRERLTAIFEPFVQVHETLTRTDAGAGLGLTISRDLARGMNGDLTVESTLGTGTTFTVHLRRAVSASGETTDRRIRMQRRTGHERRSGGDRRH